MQQTLDMIEERVRYLTRSAVGKPLTDSANVSSLPSPRSGDVGVVTSEPPPLPDPVADSVTMGDGGELPSDKHDRLLLRLLPCSPFRRPASPARSIGTCTTSSTWRRQTGCRASCGWCKPPLEGASSQT